MIFIEKLIKSINKLHNDGNYINEHHNDGNYMNMTKRQEIS